METLSLYNAKDSKALENYAKKLTGYTFGDVIAWDIASGTSMVREHIESLSNKSRKGGLGNLLEEHYFHYKINSDPSADFADAGVELKVTPYEKRKDGTLRAGERLVLTMISYEEPVEPNFYKSHLWEKCRLLLIVYYLRDKSLNSNLMYSIDYVKLFTPPEKDLAIIRQDYQKIIDKIAAGQADKISEGDTVYLGACTKGATAEKSTVPQFYPPHTLARKRAFCYKNSYMTYVLNNYIKNDITTYEPIVKNVAELKNQTFEDLITRKVNQYIGTSDKMLCAIFNREYNNNKAQWIDLAYRMLGINTNRAEEFVKANIVVKAIRLMENGKLKEHSPLPIMVSSKELIQETWEDAPLHDYLCETKFFFVLFQQTENGYILKGCKLWNMPNDDIENYAYKCWSDTQKVLKAGIKLEIHGKGKNITVLNNFPGSKDNHALHVRPHVSHRYYCINGQIIGDGKEYESDELPNGDRMAKHSFWLNKEYLMEQLNLL